MKDNKKSKVKKSHIANQLVIDEISKKLKHSKSLILFEYQGLSVSDLEGLRNNFKPLGTELKVYKNTLFGRAVKESAYTNIDEYLSGANAFMFNYENELAGLSNLTDFAKKNAKLKIKCGVINSQLLNSESIKTLSKLPNKLGMISMFLSCLQSPLRHFMNVVNAVAENKEKVQQ